jgi:hypothetical protein
MSRYARLPRWVPTVEGIRLPPGFARAWHVDATGAAVVLCPCVLIFVAASLQRVVAEGLRLHGPQAHGGHNDPFILASPWFGPLRYHHKVQWSAVHLVSLFPLWEKLNLPRDQPQYLFRPVRRRRQRSTTSMPHAEGPDMSKTPIPLYRPRYHRGRAPPVATLKRPFRAAHSIQPDELRCPQRRVSHCDLRAAHTAECVFA